MLENNYSDTTSPNYISGLASDLLRANDEASQSNAVPRDTEWVRQAFVVPVSEKDKFPMMDPDDVKNQRYSSAAIKYTNSSLGGNICINPPPMWTRYADIHHPGIRQDAVEVGVGYQPGDIGMGNFYSEAIDDNNQIIHMRFGVAQYNSLFQFFTGFYSTAAGSAARAGRISPNFLEKFLQFGTGAIALAIAPLAIVPVALLMFGTAVRYFMRWPTSRFCTLKPSMEMYWLAVTSLANQIGAMQGTINYFEPSQKEALVGKEAVFDTPDYSIFSKILPGVMSKRGTIDVMAVASRAKRLQERHEMLKLQAFQRSNGGDFFGVVKSTMGTVDQVKRLDPGMRGGPSLESYLQNFIDLEFLSKDNGSAIEKDVKYPKDPTEANAADLARSATTSPYEAESVPPDGFWSHFIAKQADGAEWVSFRVDATGPVSESFTSSTAPSSLASKINDVSRSNRDIRMNLSGGIMGDVVGAVTSALGNIGSVLHLEGLAAAAGSAFVDIPDHWESSRAQLPTASYTLTLISPYGNPVSRMFNIYIPLAMLLAGALPLSTGKQSHTSPFLVELHDRGRVMTRLGIISSMQITRGTSNLGFTNEGQVMAVDVSFTVQDLSSIAAMPIQPGFSLMPAEGLFDAENSFTDYLMALSGMNLRDVNDRMPMLKYQAKRKMAELETFFSAAHWGQYAASLPGVSALGTFMRGNTARK